MMPGTRLMRFASRWFPASVVSSVFEPLVADWQRQWNDATPAQRRLINAKGFAAFATTTVMMAPRLALASDTFRARPLILAASFWFATSILLTVPFLKDGVPLNSLWLLLPASLTLMLPFAILPAIDCMRPDGEDPTVADRRPARVLVVVAVCGVAIGQGWLTPIANQRWRELVAPPSYFGRPTLPARGLKELTTSELIAGGSTVPAHSGTPRVRELNMRGALAALPAVLAWLRWRSLSRASRRPWSAVKSCLLALGATGAFIAVLTAGPSLERLFLAPGFGPVLALGLFTFAARTGIWWRQRTI